jgi:hypothetical protein
MSLIKYLAVFSLALIVILAGIGATAAPAASPPPTVTVTETTTVTVTLPPVTVTVMPGLSPVPSPTTNSLPEGTRSDPAPLNDPLTIKVNDFGSSGIEDNYQVRMTLKEFLRGAPAWQLIQKANSFNESPKAGYEYILAKVFFEYLSGPTPDSAYDLSSILFTAISAKGKDYELESVIEPDPSIDSNLYPGASQEGWVAFLVAQDDKAPLMTFGRKYDGTGGIWFKLY